MLVSGEVSGIVSMVLTIYSIYSMVLTFDIYKQFSYNLIQNFDFIAIFSSQKVLKCGRLLKSIRPT